MDQERISRQFDFIREIDREKFIGRQTYLTDGQRKENDAEHAWHMAVMTLLLSEYANEEVDVLKTITMLLIHDIVEIDAGDTYAYDEDAKRTQKERGTEGGAAAVRSASTGPGREAAAALGGSLKPARPGSPVCPLHGQPAAHDAQRGDRRQSMDRARVELSQILKRNSHTCRGSQKLWDYALENWIRPNLEAGRIRRGDQE